jgi:hypothetical protein
MHDLRSQTSSAAERSDRLRPAARLDMPRFVAALDSEQLRHTIEADVADGSAKSPARRPST